MCFFRLVRMETNDLVLKRIPAGIRAGLVLLGGLFAMLSYGSVYTFGNMLPYMVSYLRWKVDPNIKAGSMIWLQTLMSGVPLAMFLGGVLERHLGGRRAAIIGSLLYTGGIASTYYSIQHSFLAVLVSMGLVASVGGSIAYNAILTTAQRWFPDNVGMAGGLIVGGYGCGAFVLSPLQTTFINPLDYRVNAEGFFTQIDLLERVPYVFLVMATLFTLLQCVGLFFVGQPNEEIHLETDQLIVDNRDISVSKQLKSSTFVVLFLSLTCNALWAQLVSGLYKAYGQKFIMSDIFLSLVGSVASIANALSRVICGAVVDKVPYQTCMAFVTTLGAALVWTLPLMRWVSDDVLFLVSVSCMFACIGGTFSLFPYISHRSFGKTNFGVMYGILQCALSVAGVIAGLISQFLLPAVGYDVLFLICGGFMFISFVLTSILHLTDMANLGEDYDRLDEDENS